MIVFSGETHPGAKLEHNEDAVGWLISRQVWLVADGMGGHVSGELASRIVKETVLKRFAAGDDDLQGVILRAHDAVLDGVRADPSRDGMGSTIVVAQVRGDTCQVAWCGDSRAYIWRRSRLRRWSTLKRITRDHSELEELIEAGRLRREDARGHPHQNKLHQAVGLGNPDPDLTNLALRSNDWIVLCSDGLHDTLSDAEISDVLNGSGTPNEATRRLIRAAVDHDAEDNVSVVVIHCP